MKKKTPALWAKILSWALSFVLVTAMLGAVALAMVQTLLTDTAMHERVALHDSVVSAQMERVEDVVRYPVDVPDYDDWFE